MANVIIGTITSITCNGSDVLRVFGVIATEESGSGNNLGSFDQTVNMKTGLGLYKTSIGLNHDIMDAVIADAATKGHTVTWDTKYLFGAVGLLNLT